MNSFWRVVRRGVHQRFDRADRRDRGAVVFILAVSEERAEENYWSSWRRERGEAGGGISQFLSLSVRPSPSAPCQRGLGLLLWGVGGRRVIAMGAWTDHVEWRDDASPECNVGNICGLAKARSMVQGLWVPEKGKQV